MRSIPSAFLLAFLLFLSPSAVLAPNLCDPFNPCGCAEPAAKAQLGVPLHGELVVRYTEGSFGIAGEGCGKVFDRGRVVMRCPSAASLEVVFCSKESLGEVECIEVEETSSGRSVEYCFTYRSLLRNRLYPSYWEALLWERVLGPLLSLAPWMEGLLQEP